MSSSKKLTCKGILRHRLKMQSVMLVFSASFVNCCPSYLLSSSTLPPSPISFVNKSVNLYTRKQCVRGEGGMGFWTSDR